MSKKYVSKELAKEIHVKAAPFVKWLKEAEEESEGSEEEDDENVEVSQFNHCFSLYLMHGSLRRINMMLYSEALGRVDLSIKNLILSV